MSEEGGLHVDAIAHNTYLTVDREGTEAAAATLALMTGGLPPPNPLVLTIDRPFFYAVLARTSGVILFLGKIENPG